MNTDGMKQIGKGEFSTVYQMSKKKGPYKIPRPRQRVYEYGLVS